MIRLPENFIARMKEMLGEEAPEFFACYGLPPSRGLRVNTLKISVEEFFRICPFEIRPSGTLDEGFLLKGQAENIGNHPMHMAGLFYIQEPSAMAAIAAAQIAPGMKVLDLCAAPGGKSGGAAARLKGEGLLVSNEIVPGRAKTLCRTLERLGVSNSVVTCAHPDTICGALPGYFDRVLVDAPCSGEGMFRKNTEAAEEWSPEGVAACALRQQAILKSAYKALRPGGKLIYSTCTFSREENEGSVEQLMAEHFDMELELSQRLYPHTCSGEGHFVARLAKAEGGRVPQKEMRLTPCAEKGYGDFIRETFSVPPEGQPYLLKDGRVIILNQPIPQGLGGVRMLSAGVYAGDMQSGRFRPAHGLFMAEHGGRCKGSVSFAMDSGLLRKYLEGNAVNIQGSLRGYMPVLADKWAVGFGKAVDGTLKNHLPKGLRLNQA